MAASDVRKNFVLFVDGRGTIGETDEFNPPELALKLEEYRAGGMDMPVELTMGMEALKASFTMTAYNKRVLSLFGVAEGQVVPFTAREVLESLDGSVTGVAHYLRGKITKIAPGTSKPGDKPSTTFDLSLTYYKLVHGGDTVIEVDAENMKRVVNGVDVLAAQRAALGI